MQNITVGYNTTDGTNYEGTKTKPEAVIIIIILCCAWIILINCLVFVCLILHRSAMKSFVNLQLLSFSITDILVGITAIPGSLTYYITPNIEVCSVIMCAYFVAQTATLYHAFVICLHRYITVKYRHIHTKKKCKGQLKRIITHVIVIWLSSIVLVAIPVACYARFDQSITECSLNGLFKDNYLKFLAVINAVFLLPQMGMNAVYICLFRYLSAKWKFNTRTKNTKQNDMLLSNSRVNATIKVHSLPKVNSTEHRRFNEIITNVDTMNIGVDETSRMTKSDEYMNAASYFLEDRINVCNNILKSVSRKDHRNEQACDCETGMEEQKQIKKVATTIGAPSDANYDASNTISLPMKAEPRNIEETDNQNASSYSSWTNISIQVPVSEGCRPLNSQKEKEVLCTIGMLLILLNIFITPLNLLFVIELIHDGFLSRKVKLSLMSLALINSGLNPLVYAFKMKPFREAIKSRWARCTALCRNNNV